MAIGETSAIGHGRSGTRAGVRVGTGARDGRLVPMSTFSRSWALAKSSWAVLRQDKELLALPVISSITSLLAVAPFLGIALLGMAESGRDVRLAPVGWVALFLAYLLGAYVTIFFQSALVLAANERLTGGSPTLGWALRAAGANAGRILPWALVSATVSVVLNAIQQRAGIVGRLVVGLVGLAWTLVTMLVLPILVIEQVGVRDALSRSAEAFKRTWGENVVLNGGIGLVSMLGMLAGLLAFGGLGLIGAGTGLGALVLVAVVGFVVWMLVVSVFSAALSGVFRTALYRYAMLGEEPAGFSHDQIAAAFRTRRRGLRA